MYYGKTMHGDGTSPPQPHVISVLGYAAMIMPPNSEGGAM